MVWIKTELDHIVAAHYPEADGERIEWSGNNTANVPEDVGEALVSNRPYIEYLNNESTSDESASESDANADADRDAAPTDQAETDETAAHAAAIVADADGGPTDGSTAGDAETAGDGDE